MADLQLIVGAASGVEVPAMPRRVLEATYVREVAGDAAERTPSTVQDVASTALGEDAAATLTLHDVAASTPVRLRFLSGTGAAVLDRTVTAPVTAPAASPAGEPAVAQERVELSAADLALLAAPEITAQPTTPTVRRQCRLTPVGTVPVRFSTASLRIAVIDRSDLAALGLDAIFNVQAVRTTSAELRPESHPDVAALTWVPAHVGVDGGFELVLPEAAGRTWLWWFVDGSNVALGLVDDDLGEAVRRLALPLPPFAAAAEHRPPMPDRVPVDVTETELVDNPGVFTEDPGAFCRPFSNPERILSERAFHVILRAEQPALSSEPTRRTPWFPLLDFDPPVLVDPDRAGEREPTGLRGAFERIRAAVSTRPAAAARLPLGEAVARGLSVVRPALPKAYLDLLGRADRGRGEVDADHPLDWEGDASRYQAATVVRGHILEFRVRWRSNGYSLGTVAKTLTLAPRQVKRIQKIEWERLERTRREERTQLRDQVADEVSRERTYEDTVEASLEEWARGESRSSTSAGAGGFGFASAGFVIGGGGGHSRASSSSSTSGGRETRAAEEQRLRDAVRRFADSLRRLDSLVVTEVSQEETVTGTTEIVRNANYAHSLTVIYYQILRHLKLETSLAAVRECLFVPFAIKPFTVARAYRWRESIRAGLRDQRYAAAITHLRDVMTGFVGSTIPAGRRADQPIRYIRGSMTVSLAIERPANDGAFDESLWSALRPFLGAPALGIHSRLRELVESQRDRTFQQEHAPRIAAGWADTLVLSVPGASLRADFTLASRYRFNGAVRIDFTVAVPPGQTITRQMLSTIRVHATRPLTPGSVANITSLSYTYDTDHVRRSVSVPVGVGDLVTVETGAVDPGGAVAHQAPDAWEREDERSEVIRAVQALVGHLNEHVEHYHKVIWWAMDRDRLFMLADGAHIPGTNGVSVASVIERDPIAIVGNCLVFRVSAGAFLGIDGLDSPAKLHGWYAERQGETEPMHVALPTDGLYAQTIMDECVALEEHRGDLDWVLSDREPELGEIDPSLLMTRRAEPVSTAPTPFPQTIISLQNAPEAPAPSGLAGALQAVQNAGAFRDMAGLAGTQANAAAGLQTAANLATSFGQQAAALKLAEMAADAQRTKDANQKLGTIKKAKQDELVPPEKAAEAAGKVIDALHGPAATPVADKSGFANLLSAAAATPGSEVTAMPEALRVALGGGTPSSPGPALDAFGMLSSVGSSVASLLPGLDAFREWMRKVAVFKTEVVRFARQELAAWAGRAESDPGVLAFLEAYGSAGGAPNPASWAANAAANGTAWSAGFISFVVQEAEAAAGIPGDPFRRSTLHSDYIAAAKRNRMEKNLANPFWLYRLDEVQPEEGDFLCKNRPGQNTLTFDNVQAGALSHVDVVTRVSAGQLLATGGNRGAGTVVEAAVARTNGFVTASSASTAAGPYFAILRVRTSPTEGLLLP